MGLVCYSTSVACDNRSRCMTLDLTPLVILLTGKKKEIKQNELKDTHWNFENMNS